LWQAIISGLNLSCSIVRLLHPQESQRVEFEKVWKHPLLRRYEIISAFRLTSGNKNLDTVPTVL
jgi:hypothetical protein